MNEKGKLKNEVKQSLEKKIRLLDWKVYEEMKKLGLTKKTSKRKSDIIIKRFKKSP